MSDVHVNLEAKHHRCNKMQSCYAFKIPVCMLIQKFKQKIIQNPIQQKKKAMI
jgi:hypothetical protein